jgi:hypothetical protein
MLVVVAQARLDSCALVCSEVAEEAAASSCLVFSSKQERKRKKKTKLTNKNPEQVWMCE